MTSERRRQRQQRVRHEAGDFVPTVNEDVAESNDRGSTDVIKNENIAIETKDDKQATGDHFEENRSNVTAAVKENNTRRKDERKYNHRNNEVPRGSSNRGRGGHFRGGGGGAARKSEYCAPQTRTESRSSNSTVAYQEEKSYEPVMIMESKTDAKKDTVPSLQEPTKYRRPEVISNWLRYEDLPSEDEPEEGEDYLMGEDFSQVLNLNVNKGCGGYLHLKGEMSWGSMDKTHLESHGLGALKVADLIASLGTIPLYEQLKIPEENLPIFCVSSMKVDAVKNRSSYEPNQEYVTDIEINQKILESLKLTEQEPIKLNAEEPREREKHDAYDATMKFSSAFKPEPTDVDLDTLMQYDSENLPHTEVTRKEIPLERSEKKVRTEKENTPVSNTYSNVENSMKETLINEQPSKVSPPSSSASKATFDFGLSKAATVNSSKKRNSDKKSPVAELPKTEKEESPKIDISKPTTTKKEAPVLVKESEVENLEDWLDSVLDD